MNVRIAVVAITGARVEAVSVGIRTATGDAPAAAVRHSAAFRPSATRGRPSLAAAESIAAIDVLPIARLIEPWRPGRSRRENVPIVIVAVAGAGKREVLIGIDVHHTATACPRGDLVGVSGAAIARVSVGIAIAVGLVGV